MSYRYIIAFSIITGMCILLDLYTWHGLKRTVKKRIFNFFKWFIPLATFFFFLGFILNIYRAGQGIHNAHYLLNIITGFTFGVFIAKLLIAIPFIIEDFIRYSWFLIQKICSKKTTKISVPSRRKFVRNLSLVMAAVPLSGAIYAITRGKYNFEIKKFSLSFKSLPTAFNGMKIVQFSDFHAGSFDDPEAVKYGLSLINKQNPDVIVFTGDLVNNRAVEVAPYIDMLKQLDAPHGKFAILGNHDYGNYMPFNGEHEENKNWQQLLKMYEKTGFKLLLNEHVQLQRKNAVINIIGVENWGNPPFQQFGDLNIATKSLPNNSFNILLSHDPDHWEAEIINHPKHFHLTLSGHTHGAQFGVDIPEWKWSPVKYRYKHWLGHYIKNKQHLFVSKGFGFLGFPGRIGMSPEIVVFNLKKET